MKIYGHELVEKRNSLNSIRSHEMSLQELRFFSIYLSKIDARDVSTRVVRIKVSDYCEIMNQKKPNIQWLENSTNSLLGKVVNIPNENGGYTAFQLFKKVVLNKDENDDWYIEFDAHDDALPLMFDLKREYFKYEIWNVLNLNTSNQFRMYELLKQYEDLGTREISVDELREFLGMNSEYNNRWDAFKLNVLDSCQKALKEKTDICYEYKRGKVGNGGKWKTIVFTIKHNNDYTINLNLKSNLEKTSDKNSELDSIRDKVKSLDDNVIKAKYKDVIGEYRKYADSRMTDRGIAVFDDLSQYYYPYSDLEERAATIFHIVQFNAIKHSKKKIGDFDNYMIACLTNHWKKEK